MRKRIILFALLGLCQAACAVELEPYSSSKIQVAQWNEYHASVKKELAKGRGSFKYEAGELETYSDPKSRLTISFTTPGHEAHPAWVTTRVVVEGKKITVEVVGYYAGNERAYEDFYRRMDEMAERTLKSIGQ